MRNTALFLGAVALAISPAAAQTAPAQKERQAGCVTSLEKRDDTKGYRLARQCAAEDVVEAAEAAQRVVAPIDGESAVAGGLAPGVIGGILAFFGVTLVIILDDDDDNDGGVDPASP